VSVRMGFSVWLAQTDEWPSCHMSDETVSFCRLLDRRTEAASPSCFALQQRSHIRASPGGPSRPPGFSCDAHDDERKARRGRLLRRANMEEAGQHPAVPCRGGSAAGS
jgi:hypothetical protein